MDDSLLNLAKTGSATSTGFSDSSGESSGSSSTCSVIEGTTKKEEKHQYVIPTKMVKTQANMAVWEKSQTYYDIIGFINGISVAIQGKRISSEIVLSPKVSGMIDVFKQLNKYVDQNPPIEQPQRFGNQAYRGWFNEMEKNAHILLLEALGSNFEDAIGEICVYFIESFGNQTRIDYGTGHELSFVMFLCCLFKIGAFIESDNIACALQLFNTYLIFVRRLQMTYRMEPAGSHGVWSLDDYQFVPFIWGSAQLALNSPFEPNSFVDSDIIQQYKDEFMFISCIDYICQVKTGHFAEHSNQLWSISAVQSWAKINSGLVKMYQKEILSKFPVVQHVLFGSLMVFEPVKPGTPLPHARLGFAPQFHTPGQKMPPPGACGDMKHL